MADFSKQYCEKYHSDMPGDFDIDDLFDDMPPGSYRPVICEGYGFHGLEKDHEGKLYCLFGTEWHRVPYNDITDKTYLAYEQD